MSAEKTSLTEQEVKSLIQLFSSGELLKAIAYFEEIKLQGLKDPISPRIGWIASLIGQISIIVNIKDRKDDYSKERIQEILNENILPTLNYLLYEPPSLGGAGVKKE